MKMKNLFKTAVLMGTTAASVVAIADTFNVSAAFDWKTRYPNAQLDDEYSLLDSNSKYDYGKCNFLKSIKPGDIFYDADGSGRIAGHIAIIEGVYYNPTYNQVYIRTIEAPGNGSAVQRKVLDLGRFVHNEENKILRVKSNCIYSNTIQKAVDFCGRQIGSWYPSDAELVRSLSEGPHVIGQWLYLPAKYFEPSDDPGIYRTWYCSELIYAAYYTATNGAVNLNPGDNFCWPKEIRDSEYVETINTDQYYFQYYDYDDATMLSSPLRIHGLKFDGYFVGYESCHLNMTSDETIYCPYCHHVWSRPGC